jgi:hypothetical protein
MADSQDPQEPILGRVGGFLTRRPWYKLPDILAMPRLIEIRNELRAKNLHDTDDPKATETPIPADLDQKLRDERTIDGTYNDLKFPKMGCAGRRFGRNVPLEHGHPDVANLMNPSPRLVSRELMTRDSFKPATILNLLAASWIQFMVHDWFVHKRTSIADGVDIPLPAGDDWPGGKMRVRASVPDAAPAGSTRPPAYSNLNSHWWDGSQVYGCDAETCAKLCTGTDGKMKIDANGLIPLDVATGIDLAGFSDNWWLGLGMLHRLFVMEHNHLCDELKKLNPKWDNARLFATAKLINSALMAKIHTVEWTPAILPNRITKMAMHTNWFGLVDEELQEVLKFLGDDELLGGIVGSKANHHTAPYSLTEEFVAVYRMHALMPDEFTFRAAKTGKIHETQQLPDVFGRRARAVAERIPLADLFYSFGVSHPGAVTLHNYPRHLQNLRFEDGESLDLAAVDIYRDRERGVPRYNNFRRLVHKDPLKSIDEITDNAQWREQIRKVYGNDIEKVDLMTGLYAEPLPEGFGFSDTAFRIFVLMASRRLKSDRFYTDDYGPRLYTEFGIDYIKKTTMLSLLERHVPAVKPALQGVENAFAPWKPIA